MKHSLLLYEAASLVELWSEAAARLRIPAVSSALWACSHGSYPAVCWDSLDSVEVEDTHACSNISDLLKVHVLSQKLICQET